MFNHVGDWLWDHVLNVSVKSSVESLPFLRLSLLQNFDDYCITRKELHELLMKHHKTAIELEKEKEEKLRLASDFG